MSPFLLLLFISFIQAETTKQLKQLISVSKIVQDQRGFIWFSGKQGLTRFDGENFLTFSSHIPNQQLPFTWTTDVQPVNSRLLVSTENKGLWLFDPKTGLSSPLNIKTETNSIYQAHFFHGQYYVYTESPNILYRYNPQTSTTHILSKDIEIAEFLISNNSLYYYNDNGVFKLHPDGFTQIIQAPTKKIIANDNWMIIATETKLTSYKNDQLKNQKTVNYKIADITFEYNSDNFFSIGNNNHISKYSPQLKNQNHNYFSDSKAQPKTSFHDSSGTLWLASSHGVRRLSAAHTINHERIFDIPISSIQVEVINNKIILGTYGAGLQALSNKEQAINENLTKRGLRITDLLTVGDEMYLATFDGLWLYKFNDNLLQKVAIENNNKILLKLSKKDNILFLATDGNGFITYDLDTRKVDSIIDESYNFSSPEILDILLIEDNIWLATAKGVDVYNKLTQQVENALVSPSKVVSLVSANNKVYAATKGNGIFSFDLNKELLNHFANGIDFDQMKNINNEIWAPSSNGLYRVSLYDDQLSMVAGSENLSFSSDPILHKNTIYVGHYGGVLEVPLTPKTLFNSKVYISKTTISGESHLLNKTINIDNSNEVITLDLASLDYRTGQDKRFKYQMNGGSWNNINGSQLTLTGLASGSYHLTFSGTNSLGQWSNFQAFTEIKVAFPWYWKPQMRVLYVVATIGLALLTFWLLYLRGKSINYIHNLLSTEAKSKNKTSLFVKRNLSHALALSLSNNEKMPAELQINKHKIEDILKESINELSNSTQQKEPDGLYGKSLQVALPYFIQYLKSKYQVRVTLDYALDENQLSEGLTSDIYKVIYEALTSAILNGTGQNFHLKLKHYNEKIWLTINDDADSFSNFKSQINFDMAMYFIRQIANKYNATVNTFAQQNKGSQFVISIPLRGLA